MRREDAVALSQGPSLRRFIVLYALTVGRRLWAMRQVLALVKAGGESAALVESVEKTLKYDEGLAEREDLWRQQAKQQSTTDRPDAQPVDHALDRQLTSLSTAAEKMLDGMNPNKHAALIKKGRKMLATLFPKGVGAITTLPYEDELEAVRRIVSALNGKWLDTATALGLALLVERLEELLEAFAEALGNAKTPLINYKTLRAERWLGHELMLGVVAQILGTYHAPDATSIERREALLLPILDQNQRVADYFKRRQRISDINPDTGAEMEPDALSEPLNDNEIPA